jgi:hypothetical protein
MIVDYNRCKMLFQYMGYQDCWQEGINRTNILGLRAFYDPDNTPGVYNDLIVIAWLDQTEGPKVMTYLASTDPGLITYDKAINKDGLATLMDGKLYWYFLSTRVATYYDRDSKQYLKMKYPCMRPFEAEQAVYRDANFNYQIDTDEAYPRSGGGILIHYGGEKLDHVGAWSQGCQVIPNIDSYENFISYMKMNRDFCNDIDRSKREAPYLIIDVRKIHDDYLTQDTQTNIDFKDTEPSTGSELSEEDKPKLPNIIDLIKGAFGRD